MPGLGLFFWLLAIAVSQFFRLSYLGWAGPFLSWTVLCVPPLLFAMTLPAMLGLRLRLEAPGAVTRGNRAVLTVHFTTRHLLPVGKVRVELRLHNRFTGETRDIRLRYDAMLRSQARVELPTDSCGAISCSLQRVSVGDLLGLWNLPRRCGESVRCTVLPRPVGPAQPMDLDAALDRPVRLQVKYGGGYAEEHELREYRPGDPMNSVHWKLSSKTDSMIVREAQEPRNRTIYAILRQSGENDRGLELLYWLSLELCKRELPHRLCVGDEYVVADESEAASAMRKLLQRPLDLAGRYDLSDARCVFLIRGGEVTTQ